MEAVQQTFPGFADAPLKKAQADAVAALNEGLPNKTTCTVPEAAQFLGVSVRQINYLIEDGTLLAAFASREDGAAKRHARPVVRCARPFDPARKNFLTLEELRVKRSNVGL